MPTAAPMPIMAPAAIPGMPGLTGASPAAAAAAPMGPTAVGRGPCPPGPITLGRITAGHGVHTAAGRAEWVCARRMIPVSLVCAYLCMQHLVQC